MKEMKEVMVEDVVWIRYQDPNLFRILYFFFVFITYIFKIIYLIQIKPNQLNLMGNLTPIMWRDPMYHNKKK